jgi:hypothetical protein
MFYSLHMACADVWIFRIQLFKLNNLNTFQSVLSWSQRPLCEASASTFLVRSYHFVAELAVLCCVCLATHLPLNSLHSLTRWLSALGVVPCGCVLPTSSGSKWLGWLSAQECAMSWIDIPTNRSVRAGTRWVFGSVTCREHAMPMVYSVLAGPKDSRFDNVALSTALVGPNRTPNPPLRTAGGHIR